MIKNIVFDFGGVLMDWNPRYYFKTHFNDDEKMEYFLESIASSHWNGEQDKGRLLDHGTELLVKEHPEWASAIRAYYANWTTMLKGEIESNVKVLRELALTPYALYGLTNWSHQTFPYALENYDFFQLFEGKIVVSGDEKLIKPDPKIWEVLLERYNLNPQESVFIDDNLANIRMAEKLGFLTVHVSESTELKSELENLGVLFP